VNNNDNGVGTGGGEVFSNPVTLTPGAAQNHNVITNNDGTTYNPTLDFGFTPVYALGNRVWFDTNNSRDIDFPDEEGIDDVVVELYAASDLTTLLDSTTTANGGYYLFNGLEAGEYVVIIPASNFAGVLNGYWSSGTTRNNDGSLTEIAAPDPDNNVDSDDNGTLQTSGTFNGAVVSLPVTLGPTFNEPENEGDLDTTLPGNHQGQPDNQANMTVDFGFYTIQLGNQVWNDVNNNGLLDGAEVGINGVTVELWSADGSTLLATTTTQTVGPDQGVYTFTGLPQGTYIVRLPESNFVTTGALRDFRSSTGPANEYEPAPNPDANTTDSDDNGTEVGNLGFPGGYIQTSVFALTPQGEQSFDHSLGLTTEFRVDFGVFRSAQADLAITKVASPVGYYLPGGTLTYTIVVTNNGPADVTGAVVSDNIPDQIESWTWECTDNLTPPVGPSDCTAYSGDDNFSDTVNLPFGGIITYTVTATIRDDASGPIENRVVVTPPAGVWETIIDNNTDDVTNEPALLTVTKDDGLSVVAPGSEITYEIIVTNNGLVDLIAITVTDTLPADVTFQSATPTPATAPDGSAPGGIVTWTEISLLEGDEPVKFTITVQVNAEPGVSVTNTVVAEDGNTGQRDEDEDTNQTAVQTGKALTDTNEPTSVTPSVAIGEILTYEISLDVPAGATMTNLRALDVLDFGLAFVGCVSINGGELLTTISPDINDDPTADFSPACNDPLNPTVMAEPIGNLDLEHRGRRVLFDLGDVSNPTSGDISLVVEYQVVVLNILANQDGLGGLNNSAAWTWGGDEPAAGGDAPVAGVLEASADPVEIIEPDMDIVKDVSPSVAPYGATINFTFDIYHTPESTADAFDVIATDILPPGLAFVPGSVSVTGLEPTDIIYDEPRTTLYFVWDHFPLGETSFIEFQAIFVGPAPVVNTVNLEWTSLPIDPGLDGNPIEQSEYNEYSTERWYDPPDDAGLNTYGSTSSVSITVPSALPATGFAPGVVSALPAQPVEKAYNAMNGIWIEIPDLGVRLPMLDVPISKDGWDLTWLSNQAGYLAGTTRPGDVGTMGVTAHVSLADGNPGPFQNLRKLFWGNKVIMYAHGYRYTYEVRENRLVLPRDMSVLRQDGYAWMTLITCEGYSSLLDAYTYRVAVRAVLLSVEPDNSPYPFASLPGPSAPSRAPAPQYPGGDR
jgi:LPXTG-site transpeptidase (sortase) family protein